MRTAKLSSWSILFVLALGFETAAQNLSSLAPGDRIRIALAKNANHQESGIYHALADSAIIMTSEKSEKTVKVPLAAIANLEIYRGTKRKTWSGAGIGVAVGALAGGAIGSAIGEATDPGFAGLYTFAGLVIGAPSGFLLGAIVGSEIKTKQWEEVRLGPQ